MNKIKEFIAVIITITYSILLIIFSKEVGASVLNALNICINVIIPSLYAFMVISGFIVSSNLYVILGKPFGIISRYIFRIPTELFSIFIISSVGGYPIGAKLISNMYDSGKIDSEIAEQMLSYCYLAGPAFICSVAGIQLFSGIKAGIIIFLSILISNFIIAFIIGLKRQIPPKTLNKVKLEFGFDKIIQSIYDGAKGIFSICTIIIFFSSIICILEKLNVINFIAQKIHEYTYLDYSNSIAFVKSFIEISNIHTFSKNNFTIMPLVASLLSFGGICVIIQIKGFVGNKIYYQYFYLCRFLSIILSYFLCKIFIVLFNVNNIPVILYTEVAYRQTSPIPTIFLLIMTILLLSNISMVKSKKV